MLTQSAAAALLARNDHASAPAGCPLLIVAEYQFTQGGFTHTGWDILPCDRGVLRAWMGY